MDWGIVVTIAAINITLFQWLRADMKDFEKEIRGWKEEINKETKDFHGRLCEIQERNKRS